MKTKLKVLALSAVALVIGAVSKVEAQDCCGGQPLPAGDTCCNDQPIDPTIYTCCTSAQESAWQTTYNNCVATALSTEQSAEQTETNSFNDVMAGINWVASEDCAAFSGSQALYNTCVYGVLAAEAPAIAAANTAYLAAEAGTELEYAHEKGACYDDNPGSSIYCADGWMLTTS